MLAPAKLNQLHELIAQSTQAEWLWMSGYLAALANGNNTTIAAPAKETVQETVSIIYGTETGNSKKVATQLTGKLKQQGIKTKLIAAENYQPELLAKETTVLFAISTQGEGEPPANAKALYDFLHSTETALTNLKYSIIALGSHSYPLFCQAGIDFDTQLKRLQAKAIAPITLCDDDYEPVAEAWSLSIQNALQQSVAAKPAAKPLVAKAEGKKSFVATLGTNIILNDRGSSKQVHHLEFDLSEEVIYQPGNAVGIVPQNTDATIEQLLKLLHAKPTDTFQFKNVEYTAHQLLQRVVSVHYLTATVVKKYGQLVQADIPETRMDLYDLLRIYPLPAEFNAQAVFDLLNPTTPRLYTVSSSPNAHPGQLHLTAALHKFDAQDGTQQGFGSAYLTQLKPGTKLELFLHQQKHFQIPRSDRHLIMVGESTGIAPFRSMIAERDATGATGQNWLLFGEEDFVTDFYYQSEIQSWVETGSLHHIHLAFKKNRNKSRAVHNLLEQEAQRVFQWLESGSYFFVSGSKEGMGKAVEATLLQIIADKKNVSEEEAGNYLKQLAKEGRYAKELY
ncbi:MAG TPA: flavodoxin domain-containing protein [Phnomibacter sp.]|nr:flavodoxin domain-containing protein [Phnomibacter sp.]